MLSTHILPDVERLCDHVLMLHAGALRFWGTLAELRGEQASRLEVRVKGEPERLAAALRERGCEVVIGGLDSLQVSLPAGAGTELVLAAVVASGTQLRRLAPWRASLEDAFLQRAQ
jgi:ABC-2 type transport system ATP-binding protein